MKQTHARFPRAWQAIPYQIKVHGWLTQEWSGWFDGMTITNEVGETEQPITVLSGPILDQAALHGLLTKIYNLGLPLVAVCPLKIHNQSIEQKQRIGEKS